MGQRLSSRSVARNATALYVVQFVSFLIPIAEVSILARGLGIELYGQILFCQALALAGSLLVEYGFNVNAAQQVAVQRERSGALSALFSHVMLAKLMLSFPLIVLFLLGWVTGVLDTYLPSGPLVVFILAYFVAFGFSPMWYFQGMERMARPAMLDVFLRLSGLAVLTAVIDAPGDFYWALLILAVPPLLNTMLTLFWAGRQVGRLPIPDFQRAWLQIRDGFHFFVYRSGSNLAFSAVPILLGVAAGQRAVGEFAAAEKLVKGMTSLALPFLTAVFPFFARELSGGARPLAYGRSIWLIAVVSALALMGTGAGALLGPWALDALLGARVPETLSLYYVLILLVPLRITNQSIALLLLIPAGKARSSSYAISIFSVAAVVVGAWLAGTHSGYGMAWGLVVCEAVLWVVLTAMAVGLAISPRAVSTRSPTDRAGRL